MGFFFFPYELTICILRSRWKKQQRWRLLQNISHRWSPPAIRSFIKQWWLNLIQIMEINNSRLVSCSRVFYISFWSKTTMRSLFFLLEAATFEHFILPKAKNKCLQSMFYLIVVRSRQLTRRVFSPASSSVFVVPLFCCCDVFYIEGEAPLFLRLSNSFPVSCFPAWEAYDSCVSREKK